MRNMKRFICLVIGHQEFDPEVLRAKPWDDPDFYAYAKPDFREQSCLRCGERLEDRVAA